MAYPPKKKSLTKDSTKQLFDKVSNWLCVIWGGLMKAKIRNELIEGVSFFDNLSRRRKQTCGKVF
jgi:hypothetical protein